LGVVGFTFECRISLDNPPLFFSSIHWPWIPLPVGPFGDKLLCHSRWLIINYSSTWIFLLRKDASSSEMENPSDISQEFPLHKNSATRVWTLNSNPQFREWASCLGAFVVESGVSYLYVDNPSREQFGRESCPLGKLPLASTLCN
jgi:hypothetical protein